MNICKKIDSILLDWSARSPTGLVIDVLNEENLEALKESLIANGFNENDSISIVNEISVITEKGKYPERQAYNKNGLLVTFPTPEYKARAIARGTHFEQNPKASQSNLFGGGQSAPQQPSPTPAAGQTDSSASGGGTPPPDANQPVSTPTQPPGNNIPSQPTTPPEVNTPAQGQLKTEPTVAAGPQNVSQPSPAPEPPVKNKTPEEVAAEKEIIKQVFNTSDTTPTLPTPTIEEISKKVKILKDKLDEIEIKIKEAVERL